MRLCHSGDWHLTSGPRFSDTLSALRYIIADGTAAGAELWLFGGDFAGTQVPHRCSIEERDALASLFQDAAASAPVIVEYGNHCAPGDLAIFGRLRAAHPIHVVDRPSVIQAAGAEVFCLPYPTKRFAVGTGAVGGGVEAQNQTIEEALRGILAQWRLRAAEARLAGIPTVGLMHLNIGGSVVGGGEVLIGREIELSPHDLVELGFDAGCLSHIHRSQEMAPGWWYAGAPSMQNHGEESYEPGYLLVDVESGRPPVFTRRLTPARRLVTLDVAWVPRPDHPRGWDWDWSGDVAGFADADVRVRLTVPEEHAANVPVDELEDRCTDEGRAHSVKIERRIRPTTRVRSQEIAAAKTTTEKLDAYWTSIGRAAPAAEQRERCLAKLAELEAPAAAEHEEAA